MGRSGAQKEAKSERKKGARELHAKAAFRRFLEVELT